MTTYNHYLICTVPDYISFVCPYCLNMNKINWENVLADDEYEKWSGNIDPIKCEYCGEINRFDDCEID